MPPHSSPFAGFVVVLAAWMGASSAAEAESLSPQSWAAGPMAHLAAAKPDAIGQIIRATQEPSPDNTTSGNSTSDHASADAPAATPADAVSSAPGQDAAPLPDAATLDWSPLQTAPAGLIDRAVSGPAKLKHANRAPLIVPDQAEITRQRTSASTTEISVEKPLPVDLNMKVGADMDVHAPASPYAQHRALGSTAPYSTSGGNDNAKAWASLSAPGFSTLWDKTKIKASVDPQNQQRSFETSLVKSVPLGDQLKIVVENSYKADQPLVDNTAIGGTSHGDHTIDQRATLNVLATDTSFTASNNFQASSDKWLKKIGAEQKVFGGVSITGSLGETGDGDINKSISAAYKRNW